MFRYNNLDLSLNLYNLEVYKKYYDGTSLLWITFKRFSVMYWSEDSYHPTIFRANMNGESVEDFVSSKLQFPTGLAVDYPASRLFWTDIKKDTIESVLFNGSSRLTSINRCVLLLLWFLNRLLRLNPDKDQSRGSYRKIIGISRNGHVLQIGTHPPLTTPMYNVNFNSLSFIMLDNFLH